MWLRSRFARQPPSVRDVVFAVAMAAAQCVAITGIAAHSPGRHPLGPVGYGLLIVGSLALALRRRYPVPVLAGTTAAIYAYYGIGLYWLGYALGPALLVVAVAMFTVGAQSPLRTTLIAGGAVAVLVPSLHLLIGLAFGRPPGPVVSWLGPAGFLGAATAFGVARGNHRLARAAARESAAEAERRRAEERRLAIAREVHDVVAHSLATINVQAGVAAHVADKRPEQAKAALLAIKDASHAALEDLRATLTVLRSGSTELGPAPSLARLDELTGRATELGLRVVVDGPVSGVPAPVDAAAYRIVQEAITNTVRHAVGATTITVGISRAVGRLVLDIADDGQPGPEPVAGNGLRGMRERTATVGGTLVTESGPAGFRVRAEFPVPPPDAEPTDAEPTDAEPGAEPHPLAADLAEPGGPVVRGGAETEER